MVAPISGAKGANTMLSRTIFVVTSLFLCEIAFSKDRVVVIPLGGDEKADSIAVQCRLINNPFMNITGTVLERIISCQPGERIFSGGYQSNVNSGNGCRVTSNHPVFISPTATEEEGWLVKWVSSPANACSGQQFLTYALCCTDTR